MLLHSFLADHDAARLLRVCRTIALALLPGFSFHQHVFEGESQQQMLRMRALYEAYDLRPTRMCRRRSCSRCRWRRAAGGRRSR